MPYHGLSKLSYPFHDRTITVTQCIWIREGSRSLAKTLIGKLNAMADHRGASQTDKDVDPGRKAGGRPTPSASVLPGSFSKS